jgi:hypothetical protein
MIKFFSIFFLALLPVMTWACPNCHEAVGAKNPQSTLIILAIFIAATYIPMYILLRACKKYDPQGIDGNK